MVIVKRAEFILGEILCQAVELVKGDFSAKKPVPV